MVFLKTKKKPKGNSAQIKNQMPKNKAQFPFLQLLPLVAPREPRPSLMPSPHIRRRSQPSRLHLRSRHARSKPSRSSCPRLHSPRSHAVSSSHQLHELPRVNFAEAPRPRAPAMISGCPPRTEKAINPCLPRVLVMPEKMSFSHDSQYDFYTGVCFAL